MEAGGRLDRGETGQLCRDGQTVEVPCVDIDDDVVVPSGPFLSLLNGEAVEVEVPELMIGRTEVTIAHYRRCVGTGACEVPAGVEVQCNWSPNPRGREDYPVNCVTHQQAAAYCAWAGKRLPTPTEWEKAARGGCEARGAPECEIGVDDPAYPWGTEPVPACTHVVMRNEQGDGCGLGRAHPVSSHPRGASITGAEDMLGNVFEYTNECVAARCPVFGWSWRNPGGMLRIQSPNQWGPERAGDAIGFRCLADPPEGE